MTKARRDIPSLDQVFSDETAVLVGAATGLRDATGAERAYAAIIGADGTLRFKASAPVGTGTASPLDPATVPGVREAVERGVVTRVEATHPPFVGEGEVIAVPWMARGEVLGLGIVIMPPSVAPPGDAILALVGAKVGAALTALRDCGTLTKRLAALHDATNTLDALIESSSDAIKMIDLDGHIVRWNAAAERLYGWTQAEALGRKLPQIPADLQLRTVRDIRDVVSVGKVIRREALALRKDGTTLTVMLTVIPYRDTEGNPIGVLAIAVPQSAAEVGMQPALEDPLTAFAQTLRTKLTALVGYAQLLTGSDGADGTGRRAHASRALEQHAAELAALLDDLALLSASRDGGLQFDLQEVDVPVVVTDAVSRAEQSGLARRFIVDFEPGVTRVLAERRRLAQAIEAVFTLLDARAAEGDDLTVTVEHAAESVVIELSAPTADALPGADAAAELGAHMARVLLEAQGGTLSGGVESDRGLVMRITLPVATEA